MGTEIIFIVLLLTKTVISLKNTAVRISSTGLYNLVHNPCACTTGVKQSRLSCPGWVAKLKNKLYPPLHILFPDESKPMDYTKYAPLIIVFLPDKIQARLSRLASARDRRTCVQATSMGTCILEHSSGGREFCSYSCLVMIPKQYKLSQALRHLGKKARLRAYRVRVD